ncbi:hypothetical protein A5647_15420 [Mycobacterium sp. 1100029.7]|nr:hypothetical protein A5647_15420 [Mycobacterium sp. 1100029.7]
MNTPDPRRRSGLRGTTLSVIVVAAGLSACSSHGATLASTTSSKAPSNTTVMLDQHTHTIVGNVECTTSASAPQATPPESGDLTTRVSVHDDSASVSLALSDEKPPSVDGFSVSFETGNGRYQLPYQPTQSANQVLVTKDGKSYTITGTGQGTAPGQSGLRQVTFGIHVTCP